MEDRRSLKEVEYRQPPLTPGDSMLNITPERRRIVAQVRRDALKRRLLGGRSFCWTMRRFVDNSRWQRWSGGLI